MFFLLYKHTDDGVFDDFPKICDHFPKISEDYKEGYLMEWTNYMSPCNSIVGLYFKGTCDVISVTMATHKVHKNGL